MSTPKLTAANTRILMCCHNRCTLSKDESGILMPIGTASVLSASDWGEGKVQRDDSVNGEACDNIAGKDRSFCELTKWYWAWKNMKRVCPDIKYIGSYHYRRFFCFDETNPWAPEIVRSTHEVASYRLDVDKLSKILAKHDVIAARPFIQPYPVITQYCHWHQSMDMSALTDVVRDMYPDYKRDFDKVIYRGNSLAGLNLFVMRWEDFDAYCQWLFDILFEVDKRINYSYYSEKQARVISFLSERLFGVYMRHNFKKPKYLNVYFYTDERKAHSKLQDMAGYMRFQAAWMLTKRYYSNTYEIYKDCRLYIRLRRIAGKILRKLHLKH